MRYMYLGVIHIRFMDIGGHRHNYGGFYEKTSFQISINRGRTTTTQGAHAKPW